MGCRGPNLILLVRSVDVDIAVIGVGVLFLKAMKAEDAGEERDERMGPVPPCPSSLQFVVMPCFGELTRWAGAT